MLTVACSAGYSARGSSSLNHSAHQPWPASVSCLHACLLHLHSLQCLLFHACLLHLHSVQCLLSSCLLVASTQFAVSLVSCLLVASAHCAVHRNLTACQRVYAAQHSSTPGSPPMLPGCLFTLTLQVTGSAAWAPTPRAHLVGPKAKQSFKGTCSDLPTGACCSPL